MHFSHFAAIFPGSACSLPCVGGGPQMGPVTNDHRRPGPGSRPGALLISAHQTARARRNYGFFDQYLTKNKKLRIIANLFCLVFQTYLKVCNVAGSERPLGCILNQKKVSEAWCHAGNCLRNCRFGARWSIDRGFQPNYHSIEFQTQNLHKTKQRSFQSFISSLADLLPK